MPTMIILTVNRARAQIPVHTCRLTAWYMNLFVHSTAVQPMTSRPAHPDPPKYLLLLHLYHAAAPSALPWAAGAWGPPDIGHPVSRAVCGHTYWEWMIWVLLCHHATPFFFMIHYSLNKQIRGNQ